MWLSAVVSYIGPAPTAGRARFAYTVEDVTDRKRAERAVAAEAERAEVAQLAGRATLYEYRPRTGEVFRTLTLRALLGYTPDEVEATKGGWRALVHPDDVAAFDAAVEAMLHSGQDFSLEYRVRHKDGHPVWVADRARAIRGPDGAVERLVGLVSDITDRKRAEAALRTSEERFRAMANTTPAIIWTADATGAITFHNLRWLDYTGIDPADNARDWPRLVLHPDDFDRCVAAWQEAVARGTEYEIEVRNRRRDGVYRWFLTRATPIRDAGGRIVEWHGSTTDIDDRKQTEAALRTSEQRLRAIADHLPRAAVFVVGTDLRFQLVAGEALAPAGVTPAMFDGRSLLDFPPGSTGDGIANYRRALAGESFQVEHAVGERYFITHGRPLRDPAGRVTAALAVSYDITDRKRAEEALRQVRDELETRVAARTAELEAEIERRHTLTRLLASAQEDERRRVARDLHDTVGQLLAGLALEIKAVALAGPVAPAAAARLDRALHLTDTLGRELHALAVRLRPTALDDLGLEAAVRQLVENWAAHAGVGADFQFTGPAERFASEVETTLFRIVQEALTNVGKHAGARHVAVVVRRSGGHVVAVIEDDGAGFDPEQVTPAPDSERDGRARLGLLGMRERVGLLGGALEVESAPGRGTTIIARLPLALDPVR